MPRQIRYGAPVTDPALLAQLEGGQSPGVRYGAPVTDPALLAQLEGGSAGQGQTPAAGGGSLADMLKSYYQGEANMGRGVAHALNNLGQSVYQQGIDRPLDFLLGTQLTAKDRAAQQANNQDFEQKYGDSNAAKAGNIVGSVAPFAIAPEAMGINLMPELLGSRLLGAMGANSAYGAGANAITGNDPLAGGVLGALGGAAGAGVNSAINALRPSNALRGELSPQELKQNLAATAGTNTPLGDVIASPGLKRLYDNILTKIPLSGANSRLQQTGKQIVSQGNDILSQLLGENTPGDVGSLLQKSLKSRLNNLEQIKRNNYGVPEQIADNLGIKVGRENFSKTAQNSLEEIKKSPELMRETNPSLISDLQNYSDPEAANNLKLSNIFRGKIGDKASDAYTNNQKYEYGIYKNLKDALGQDIDSAIDTSGSDTLKNAHQDAQNFYRNEIAPFEDPNVLKFTKRGGDTDTLLSTFIKSGRTNDRGNLVNTLVNKLPDDQKTLPAYGWLSKSLDDNGNVNPLKLATLYRNLGAKQKAALLPDAAIRQKMDNFANLTSKNNKALTVMANPATGQQVMDVLTYLGSLLGYHLGGMGGAVAGLGAAAATTNPLVRALTNPAIRTNLVQKMIAGGNQSPLLGNRLMGALATPNINNPGVR